MLSRKLFLPLTRLAPPEKKIGLFFAVFRLTPPERLMKSRWRPLEAALTAVGSQAETIQECIDDEQESGRNRPIDIESLLSNVIPTILGQSGELIVAK